MSRSSRRPVLCLWTRARCVVLLALGVSDRAVDIIDPSFSDSCFSLFLCVLQAARFCCHSFYSWSALWGFIMVKRLQRTEIHRI
ncbi:hypothetical protein DFH07DRAFT_112121 [Mycena maculata]|uniref:Secreted protein n=1 Tax=Mycena maculata TaxID=230809 RepID=A0AAD7I6K3_9AGAR|nr:hypothetical protein DFH07DRAFT_112121 [Mycena maculata]